MHHDLDRITIESEICKGKPAIRNKRITVGTLWAYAKEHDLTIVSKDADFSDRVLLSEPPLSRTTKQRSSNPDP